jgi:hypothetical protein
MIIRFFEKVLGFRQPWLKLFLLIIAVLVSGLIVYGVQHVRMNELRRTQKELEINHIKEISTLKETFTKQISEMEKRLKSTTITVEKTLPDGTKTIEKKEDVDLTESVVIKTEVVEKIVEVIKEVEIIKVVESEEVIVIPTKNWAVGISIEPLIQANTLGVQSIGVTAGYNTNDLFIMPFVHYKFNNDREFINNFQLGVSVGIKF